jgi:hypothetical protein
MSNIINQIPHAETTIDLDNLVERAARELGCQLDNSLSYAENADWFEQDENRDGAPEMAKILRAAETRWFELGA